MFVAARRTEALEMRANARRLIDGELFGDGEMQRQVQERIDVAALRLPVPVEIALGVFEDRVILGMLRDEIGGDPLDARRRLPRAVFPPRLDQETAGLVAGRIEQRAAYAVLSRYSQRSRSVHAPQSGLRATQT